MLRPLQRRMTLPGCPCLPRIAEHADGRRCHFFREGWHGFPIQQHVPDRSLARRGYFSWDTRLRNRLPRILAAVLVMAAILAVASHFLTPWLALPGIRLGALAILLTAGLVVFGGAVLVTGATRLSDLSMLRRRR